MRTSITLSRLPLTVVVLLVGMLAIGGCGKKSANLSTRNQVIWWIQSDVERLNPLIAEDANSQYVDGEIWEALNSQNPVTLETIPCLGSLADISADHLTYTFTMNPKAHWSDGKPVTSEDVIFTFKMLMNPRIPDLIPLQNYFYTLDSAYNPNGDKSKVAFHVSKPYFQEENVLGQYVHTIPMHIWDPQNLSAKISWADLKDPKTTNPAIDELGKNFSDPAHDRDPKFQVGSGAYMYCDWKTFDHITLRRDTGYWGWDTKWFEAYPDTLIFKTITDFNAALTSLKSQQIDIMPQVTAQQYLNDLDLVKFPYLKKDTVYYNQYSFIAWNNEKPMFSSVKTRKALTQLIDRDQILKSVIKGLAKKNDGPICFTQPNFDPSVKQVEFNVDAAKKLLAEDGWTDSDGDGILDKVIDGKKVPFSFTFLVVSGNDVARQVLLIISESLRKVGIEAQISQVEGSVWSQRLRSHQYEATYSNWNGNASEDEIYQLWYSTQSAKGGSNYYSFKNADADKLMDSIRIEFDVKKRNTMNSQLAKIIVDQQPVSFMFAVPTRIGWVDRFDNLAFFRQRPNFDPRYFVVRGRDIKRSPNEGDFGTKKAAATMIP